MEIGIDIEETKRFASMTRVNSFVKRFFSKREINYCFSKPEPAQSLAARFAAKEAYYKCTGKVINFINIEILNNKKNKPEMFINGKMHKKVRVSLSHTKDYAVSVVVVV